MIQALSRIACADGFARRGHVTKMRCIFTEEGFVESSNSGYSRKRVSDGEDPYLNQIPMRDASSPDPLLACASAILCYRIAAGQVRQLFYYIGTNAFGDSQIIISLVGE